MGDGDGGTGGEGRGIGLGGVGLAGHLSAIKHALVAAAHGELPRGTMVRLWGRLCRLHDLCWTRRSCPVAEAAAPGCVGWGRPLLVWVAQYFKGRSFQHAACRVYLIVYHGPPPPP